MLEFESDRMHRRVNPVMLTYADAGGFELGAHVGEGPDAGQRQVEAKQMRQVTKVPLRELNGNDLTRDGAASGVPAACPVNCLGARARA